MDLYTVGKMKFLSTTLLLVTVLSFAAGETDSAKELQRGKRYTPSYGYYNHYNFRANDEAGNLVLTDGKGRTTNVPITTDDSLKDINYGTERNHKFYEKDNDYIRKTEKKSYIGGEDKRGRNFALNIANEFRRGKRFTPSYGYYTYYNLRANDASGNVVGTSDEGNTVNVPIRADNSMKDINYGTEVDHQHSENHNHKISSEKKWLNPYSLYKTDRRGKRFAVPYSPSQNQYLYNMREQSNAGFNNVQKGDIKNVNTKSPTTSSGSNYEINDLKNSQAQETEQKKLFGNNGFGFGYRRGKRSPFMPSSIRSSYSSYLRGNNNAGFNNNQNGKIDNKNIASPTVSAGGKYEVNDLQNSELKETEKSKKSYGNYKYGQRIGKRSAEPYPHQYFFNMRANNNAGFNNVQRNGNIKNVNTDSATTSSGSNYEVNDLQNSSSGKSRH